MTVTVAPPVVPMIAADQNLMLVLDDPHTLTGPGTTCLSCGEELPERAVYAYATTGTDHGIVGDCCLTW